ncbi:Rieske (2Fe-2S) protein [Leptospira ilyithenensis]|uniref:Non-heme iron oxygenase ferredoxin subunit n=1 Tax=Leptospira ilyithenensis TaxID=2484901 RepID=A0A4R9LPM3_9LEPT|nr:non-heme iron oxygenase ferredoxin subunit [Leptospira ilyithenensis]TGN08131.1 non-heme iron oxygenase ferredoxin subunit [Leptospira ilyithenensis]
MAFQKLAKFRDIKEGEMTVVNTRYTRVALTKIGETYLAFEDLCTHDGEEISCGKLEGDVITCPRHFAKFNIRTGEVVSLPATENLPVFKTKLNGDDLEVDLED